MNAAVIVGWAAKGLVIVLSLLNTRLLVELVGAEGLAAYAIIASLAVWLTLLNLGMPTAVQNLISESRAKGLDVAKVKKTAFAALSILFLIFLPIVMAGGAAVKFYFLASYDFVSVSAVIQACILMFISALGLLFSQMLYAEHRAVWANLYPAFNAIGISICLLILNALAAKDYNLILVSYFLPMLLVFILGAVQTRAFSTWEFDLEIARRIWAESRGLLLFATLSACTLAVDYLVMSNLLQAQDIAQYNLSSRLFLTILTIHSVLLATAWPQISELMHGRRMRDARKKLFQVLHIGLLLGVVSGGILLVAMDWIIPLLAGDKVESVPASLIISWCIYILIRIWSDTFSVGLLCVGQTKPINQYIPFQALFSVLGQYTLTSLLGVTGVTLGLIASFLMTAAWILPKKFLELTRDAQ